MKFEWIEQDQRFAFSEDDEGNLSRAEFDALFAGQSQGKLIVKGSDGRPTLADPAPLTSAQLAAEQILQLETSITPRRVREAILGIDSGWLKNVNDQIAAIRATLS